MKYIISQLKSDSGKKKQLSILNISLTSGGAEKVISLLLKKLVIDYNVTLFLFYNRIHFPIPGEVQVISFKENPPKYYNPITKIWDFCRFIILYSRLLKKLKIQYAVSFLAAPNLINGVISIFHPKRTTIISERGYPSYNTSSKFSLWLSKVFYPLLYNRCDKLFSNSIYINQDLRYNFGIKIPMKVVYNPIEFTDKTKNSEELAILPGPLKIITVGRLNEGKNHKLIINALKTSELPFHLTLLGAGNLENELKSLVHSLDLTDSVTFAGTVKNVADYLVQNDLFILSSLNEGFPNALLEAMSIGLPCISTNCLSGPLELLHDGQPIEIKEGEYFQGRFGILINNNDEIAMTQAIQFLRNNPEKRVHYSKMSLIKSKDYELDTIYAQFKDFIQN